MTDKTPPARRQPATEQPAEPPILRDVVEPMTSCKSMKGAAQKPPKAPDESQQTERNEQAEEFLDKYDLSQVEEERRERRWARR